VRRLSWARGRRNSNAEAARRLRSFLFLLQAVTSCGEFLTVTARAYAKVHSTRRACKYA
jgi:hypothetical protein